MLGYVACCVGRDGHMMLDCRRKTTSTASVADGRPSERRSSVVPRSSTCVRSSFSRNIRYVALAINRQYGGL